MPLKIRETTLEDVKEVQRLVYSLRYYYLKDPQSHLPNWFNEMLTFDAFLERFTSDEFVNIAYEKSGNIHGYMAIKKPNTIYHLFVAESVHNKGVGSQLWQYANQLLELKNEPVINLISSLGAVRFYEKLGFISTSPAVEKDGICYQPMQLHQKVTA